MKKIYILLFLFIPIVAFPQMRERFNSNDMEKYGLKGKIKEIVQKEYEPIFSNDSTYVLEILDFLVLNNYKIEFDKNGNLHTKTEFSKDNDSLIPSAVWKYIYDSGNRIFQEERNSFQHFKDTIIWKYAYIGDSIINIKQLDKTFNVLYYSYKQKGNLEYLNFANSDSSYLTKKLFVYDKQNRPIRFEDYKDKDYVQDLRITIYKNPISNEKFKEIMIQTNYNNITYNEFGYDENRNVITMKNGDFINPEYSLDKYEYIYDEKGNWIEKSHFGWRGSLSRVIKREIIYFE